MPKKSKKSKKKSSFKTKKKKQMETAEKFRKTALKWLKKGYGQDKVLFELGTTKPTLKAKLELAGTSWKKLKQEIALERKYAKKSRKQTSKKSSKKSTKVKKSKKQKNDFINDVEEFVEKKKKKKDVNTLVNEILPPDLIEISEESLIEQYKYIYNNEQLEVKDRIKILADIRALLKEKKAFTPEKNKGLGLSKDDVKDLMEDVK